MPSISFAKGFAVLHPRNVKRRVPICVTFELDRRTSGVFRRTVGGISEFWWTTICKTTDLHVSYVRDNHVHNSTICFWVSVVPVFLKSRIPSNHNNNFKEFQVMDP